MKELSSFKDVEKVLINYKKQIQQCLNIAADAQKLANSANIRTNDYFGIQQNGDVDVVAEMKSIARKMEIQLDQRISSINNELLKEIEQLRRPWYRKMIDKCKKKAK